MGSCQQAAVRAGARIVHSCGFDSVPSDLGVLLAHHAAGAGGAGDLQDTTGNRRIVTDPHALNPDRAAEPALGGERELSRARYDPGVGQWTGPFVLAGFSTRIVRRSNALQGWAYGRQFRYREVTGFGTGPAGHARALAVTADIGHPSQGHVQRHSMVTGL